MSDQNDLRHCPSCWWEGKPEQAVLDGSFRCCPQCHTIVQNGGLGD